MGFAGLAFSLVMPWWFGLYNNLSKEIADERCEFYTSCLRRYVQKGNAFPSKRFAAKKWRISAPVWRRARDDLA